MANLLFVMGIASLVTPLFIWAFTSLPQERWQMIAAVPVKKTADNDWQGLNLTFYGLFNALALTSGVALTLVLTTSAGVEASALLVIVGLLLAVCLPASRVMARWVEKKPNTFSIGAASFTGMLLGPWVAEGANRLTHHLLSTPRFDTLDVVAALVIGYTLGEGLGRLACISFGCCYGNPIDQAPRIIRRYFSWATLTYAGCTKKIAYAHHLEGKRILAVPAFTAVVYTSAALIGSWLFLNGQVLQALFLCLLVTQGWRFSSEFLRSDDRGGRTISVYQIMSLATIPYALLLVALFPFPQQPVNLVDGLHVLWDPAVLLFLQALGVIMFFRTGRSRTTGSTLTFHVNRDQI